MSSDRLGLRRWYAQSRLFSYAYPAELTILNRLPLFIPRCRLGCRLGRELLPLDDHLLRGAPRGENETKPSHDLCDGVRNGLFPGFHHSAGRQT